MSDQAAQGFIQAGLGNLQNWKLHNLSQQPVHLLGCPHGEKMSPYVWTEALLHYTGHNTELVKAPGSFDLGLKLSWSGGLDQKTSRQCFQPQIFYNSHLTELF